MAVTPYNRALDLLSARAYSAKDLQRKLLRKGVTPDDAEAVIARLIENGLLDDRRYAFAYARSKLTSGSASPRRVLQDLSRKGVARAVAVDAVAQLESEEEIDPRASLERLARKKLAQMGDLPPLVLRRRLYAFLGRRGYDADEIQSTISAVLGGER